MAPVDKENVATAQRGDGLNNSGKPATPAPQLPSNYRVLKQLGKGAYGEVFLCDDRQNGQQVAIKWIRDFARDPTFGKRILREIRILAALEHPNLLTLVDLLPVPSRDFSDVYISMPYMQTDLHKVIYSKMVFSDGHAQAFACQILRGVGHLHSMEIVHRDLKPSNILVNADCTLRIADFGLARGRVCEEEVLTDYVVTRWYRAPELMLCPSGYFEAVDLWSVGCIHAELLARRPLFQGANHFDMLKRITRCLRFSRERDLAWLPDDENRGSVLSLVDSLGLNEWPLQQPEEPLEERLPRASEACLDFVYELLTFDPTRRISAIDALSHRYLAHLKDPSEEPPPRKFSWTFDNFEPTKQALKERVYNVCAERHPEIIDRDAPKMLQQPPALIPTPLGPPPARPPRSRAARVHTNI